jgi:hypothetical protein
MSQLPRIRFRSLALGAVAAGAVLALAGLPRATARPKAPLLHLLPPENVAAATRVELRSRMNRHGNDMSSLVRAVVLLDRPTVAALAGRISDEELLARSDTRRADPWRPLLPPGFFVEQEALRKAASELAEAAAHGQPDDVLAERFGLVTRTCVRCHGAYLHDLPGETPAH